MLLVVSSFPREHHTPVGASAELLNWELVMYVWRRQLPYFFCLLSLGPLRISDAATPRFLHVVIYEVCY